MFYDASQVIINTEISIPSSINDEPLLFIEQATQVDKKISEVQNISKEQKSLGNHLSLYNLFDYLGFFLENEAEYEHFISITLKSMKKSLQGKSSCQSFL